MLPAHDMRCRLERVVSIVPRVHGRYFPWAPSGRAAARQVRRAQRTRIADIAQFAGARSSSRSVI